MPHKVQRKNHYAPRPGTAMREMNLTPFIDVLLVLLIMLILAMPVKFHVTEVPLPSGEARFAIQSENTVHISAEDKLYWNGNAVTANELRSQIAAANRLKDQPLLNFAPDPQASYNTSANVIALIKRGGVEKFAFIGNAAYRDFDS